MSIELFIITSIHRAHKRTPRHARTHTAIGHPSNRTCQKFRISSQPLNTSDQSYEIAMFGSTECKRTGEVSFVNLVKWFRSGLKWSCFVAIDVVNSCINNDCECAKDQRHYDKKNSFTFAALIISTTPTTMTTTAPTTIHLFELSLRPLVDWILSVHIQTLLSFSTLTTHSLKKNGSIIPHTQASAHNHRSKLRRQTITLAHTGDHMKIIITSINRIDILI